MKNLPKFMGEGDLTATDYFMEWFKAIPTQNSTDSVVINFLEENILSRFGCP
jgi:hypothetical protein